MAVVCRELYGECSPFAVIEDFIVAKAYRRRGIGKATMERAEKRLKARKCGIVQLVTERNRKDAVGFYRALGFLAGKHGGFKKVGLLLVTQRPTELPKTALAQCGTIIALRLSNSEDQGAIKTALPDAIAGLAAVLPSLRTHEAIISGESLVLPARTLLDAPDPWPKAEDPSLEPWRRDPTVPNVEPALKAWRETYQ